MFAEQKSTSHLKHSNGSVSTLNSNMTKVSCEQPSTSSNKRSCQQPLSGTSLIKKKKTESEPPKLKEPNRDIFCWKCHKFGTDVISCTACPRVFHFKCSLLEERPVDWICFQCNDIRRSEGATRSSSQSSPTSKSLTKLLLFVLKRMRQHEGCVHFENPVNLMEYPDYTLYIVNSICLSEIEEKIMNNNYHSCEAFLADTRWLVHNSYIFNTAQSEFTLIARSIVKMATHECEEIVNCPDCYWHANTLKPNEWFIETCRVPHILVWARLKGWPYWPAKVMSSSGSNIDVRFFGDHNRANVSADSCFLYSKQMPTKQKKSPELDIAIEETQKHIEKLIAKFGKFCFSPPRVELLPKDEDNQRRLLLPGYKGSTDTVIYPSPPKKLKPNNEENHSKSIQHIQESSDISTEASPHDSPTVPENSSKFLKTYDLKVGNIVQHQPGSPNDSSRPVGEDNCATKNIKVSMNQFSERKKHNSTSIYPKKLTRFQKRILMSKAISDSPSKSFINSYKDSVLKKCYLLLKKIILEIHNNLREKKSSIEILREEEPKTKSDTFSTHNNEMEPVTKKIQPVSDHHPSLINNELPETQSNKKNIQLLDYSIEDLLQLKEIHHYLQSKIRIEAKDGLSSECLPNHVSFNYDVMSSCRICVFMIDIAGDILHYNDSNNTVSLLEDKSNLIQEELEGKINNDDYNPLKRSVIPSQEVLEPSTSNSSPASQIISIDSDAKHKENYMFLNRAALRKCLATILKEHVHIPNERKQNKVNSNINLHSNSNSTEQSSSVENSSSKDSNSSNLQEGLPDGIADNESLVDYTELNESLGDLESTSQSSSDIVTPESKSFDHAQKAIKVNDDLISHDVHCVTNHDIPYKVALDNKNKLSGRNDAGSDSEDEYADVSGGNFPVCSSDENIRCSTNISESVESSDSPFELYQSSVVACLLEAFSSKNKIEEKYSKKLRSSKSYPNQVLNASSSDENIETEEVAKDYIEKRQIILNPKYYSFFLRDLYPSTAVALDKNEEFGTLLIRQLYIELGIDNENENLSDTHKEGKLETEEENLTETEAEEIKRLVEKTHVILDPLHYCLFLRELFGNPCAEKENDSNEDELVETEEENSVTEEENSETERENSEIGEESSETEEENEEIKLINKEVCNEEKNSDTVNENKGEENLLENKEKVATDEENTETEEEEENTETEVEENTESEEDENTETEEDENTETEEESDETEEENTGTEEEYNETGGKNKETEEEMIEAEEDNNEAEEDNNETEEDNTETEEENTQTEEGEIFKTDYRNGLSKTKRKKRIFNKRRYPYLLQVEKTGSRPCERNGTSIDDKYTLKNAYHGVVDQDMLDSEPDLTIDTDSYSDEESSSADENYTSEVNITEKCFPGALPESVRSSSTNTEYTKDDLIFLKEFSRYLRGSISLFSALTRELESNSSTILHKDIKVSLRLKLTTHLSQMKQYLDADDIKLLRDQFDILQNDINHFTTMIEQDERQELMRRKRELWKAGEMEREEELEYCKRNIFCLNCLGTGLHECCFGSHYCSFECKAAHFPEHRKKCLNVLPRSINPQLTNPLLRKAATSFSNMTVQDLVESMETVRRNLLFGDDKELIESFRESVPDDKGRNSQTEGDITDGVAELNLNPLTNNASSYDMSISSYGISNNWDSKNIFFENITYYDEPQEIVDAEDSGTDSSSSEISEDEISSCSSDSDFESCPTNVFSQNEMDLKTAVSEGHGIAIHDPVTKEQTGFLKILKEGTNLKFGFEDDPVRNKLSFTDLNCSDMKGSSKPINQNPSILKDKTKSQLTDNIQLCHKSPLTAVTSSICHPKIIFDSSEINKNPHLLKQRDLSFSKNRPSNKSNPGNNCKISNYISKPTKDFELIIDPSDFSSQSQLSMACTSRNKNLQNIKIVKNGSYNNLEVIFSKNKKGYCDMNFPQTSGLKSGVQKITKISDIAVKEQYFHSLKTDSDKGKSINSNVKSAVFRKSPVPIEATPYLSPLENPENHVDVVAGTSRKSDDSDSEDENTQTPARVQLFKKILASRKTLIGENKVVLPKELLSTPIIFPKKPQNL